MSQDGNRSSLYHEIETSKLNKYLLNAKEGNHSFQVKCSKAILNCLLQRKEFKKDVKVMIGHVEVNILYDRLKLKDHFKTNDVDEWVEEKGKILGSILAISQALSTISVDLSPLEEFTYTTLVENPSAYICWMQNGWTALRKIKNDWFLLNPRVSAPEQISGTYLHLIIGQLIAEKELIFKVSGGEFSPPYQRVDSSALRTYPHSLLPSAAYPLLSPPDGKYIYLEQITCSEHSSVPTTSTPDRSEGPVPNSQKSDYSCTAASSVQNNPITVVPSQINSKESLYTSHPKLIRNIKYRRMLHLMNQPIVLSMPRRIGEGYRAEQDVSPTTSSSGQIDSSRYELPTGMNIAEGQQQRSRQPRIRNAINLKSRPVNRSHSVSQESSDRQTVSPLEERFEWLTIEQSDPRHQRARFSRSRSDARNIQRTNNWAHKDEPNSSSTVVDKGSTSRSTSKENTTVEETEKHSSCCICMDARPEIAFIPCGHMCICASCSQTFRAKKSLCPICRKLIVSSLKVFTP